MTVMIEPDTRGIDALSGKLDDNVASMPTLIWDELVAALGPVPDAPFLPSELEFDEAPWQELPTLAELETIWSALTPLDSMLHELAVRVHGDGPDLMEYMARQQWLADIELELKRGTQDGDAGAQAVDGAGSGRHGPDGAADPAGGGADLSGKPENGDKVVKSGKAPRDPNSWGAQKVSRRRGAGKASRGRGVVDAADTAEDP